MKRLKNQISLILVTALVISLAAVNVSAFTQTDFNGWSELGTTAGQTLTNVSYKVTSTKTITASAGNGSAGLIISGTVSIYIASGCTLTVNGGNGNGGNNAGGAGIYLPSGATLKLYGQGTLVANGGAGTAATASATGGIPAAYYTGSGSAGGNGGGGPGAGIGGNGGAGGTGGGGGSSSGSVSLWAYSANAGSAGNGGGAGGAMGTLYVYDKVTVTATAGTSNATRGTAGAGGTPSYEYNQSGSWKGYACGGSGGGGGAGGNAANIGGGGAGGGGGGGASGGGGGAWNTNSCFVTGAGGGGGGGANSNGGYGGKRGEINMSGTPAANKTYGSNGTDSSSTTGAGGGAAGATINSNNGAIVGAAGKSGGNAGGGGAAGAVYKVANATVTTPSGGTTTSGNGAASSVSSASQTYAVTLDNQGATTSGTTSASATYGSAMPSITIPTKTGYTFNGYFAGTGGTGTKYYTNTGASNTNWDQYFDTTLYAGWTLNQYTITWDASTGGSGGTITQVNHGVTPTPPSGIIRSGYDLTGWSPTIVAATGPATYTAQWTVNQAAIDAITVTLTENTSDMTLTVDNAVEGCKYQIWTYQEISEELFDGNPVVDRQWILSKAYDLSGQVAGTLSYNIGKFISPDDNYTIAVRIIDGNETYVCEIRDSFTKTAISSAEITEVFVDGLFVKLIDWGQSGIRNSYGPEYDLYKEIKTGATTTIKVMGNISGMTYTATILETMATITASGIDSNEFEWDISGVAPRTLTVRLTASNSGTTSTRDLNFHLYKTSGITFADITGLTIGSTTNAVPQNVNITPSFANGNFFYTIGEQGRDPKIVSGQLSSSGSVSQEIASYGIYRVIGYVNRPGILVDPDWDSYDDVIAQTMKVSRSPLPSTMTLNASGTSVTKGTTVTFDASASIAGIGGEAVQYSFWRLDAQGYSIVKDWSSGVGANTFTWKTGRVGRYYIEARAKGEDAGSYEVINSVLVEVTDGTASKALGVSISINETELAGAKARIPVIIKANATATNTKEMLYKFNVGDSEIGMQTIQNFSADQYCVWQPKEAGTYRIDVLVKSSDSFGQFDEMKTIEISVT